MKIAWIILLTLAAAACTPGTAIPDMDTARLAADGLVLQTDRSSYAAGEPVQLTLRNETGGPLGVNLCLSTLEQRRGGEWGEAPRQFDEVCTALLQLLEPGQSASHTFTVAAGFPTGEYRLRTRIERMHSGDADFYVSNPFRLGN
jgi:hypothetical protein